MLALDEKGCRVPWQERITVEQRREFVAFVRQEDANISAFAPPLASTAGPATSGWPEEVCARSWAARFPESMMPRFGSSRSSHNQSGPVSNSGRAYSVAGRR